MEQRENVRRADCLLATEMHARRVPTEAVANALIRAAARRFLRAVDAPSLGTVRSLAYFVPVIDEVLQIEAGPE